MQTLLLAKDGPLFGINERGIILFGFEIYFYAICIVTGMLLAAYLSSLLMRRRNINPELILTLFIVCIPSALICARLYYCITDGMPLSQWFDWESIRKGGLSILGGVMGGVLAGLVVCLIKKIEFLRVADCVVLNILVAQALGRWGNFFNAEVYGAEVENPAFHWFPFAVPISSLPDVFGIGSFSDPNADWHYAFFFYESCINLIGWALLFYAAWKWDKKPNGLFVCAYFFWYGLVRSIMEPLRDPDYILSGGGIRWSFVTSLILMVLGLIGAGVLLFLNYRKEGAVIGSKTGDPCGITAYIKAYKDDVPYFDKVNLLGANYPPAPPKEKEKKEEEVYLDPTAHELPLTDDREQDDNNCGSDDSSDGDDGGDSSDGCDGGDMGDFDVPGGE